MKYNFKQQIILSLFVVLGVIGCEQPTKPVYKKPADFFEQKKYKDGYMATLPYHSIDSLLMRIRADVPSQWYGMALESAFYQRPDLPDSVKMDNLDKYDVAFPHDSIRAFTQLMRGQFFAFQDQFDKAETYFSDCYNLSIKGNRLLRASDAQFNQGHVQVKRGDYPEGLASMQSAYGFCSALYPNDGGRILETIQTISNNYNNIGDYTSALIWLHKMAQYINQDSVNYSLKIGMMTGLARNYLPLNQLDSAKMMIDSAFYLQEKHKIYYNAGVRHFFRAEIYTALGDCSSVMTDYWAAKRDPAYSGNPIWLGRFNKGLGNGYFCTGRLDSALFFYQQALKISDTIAQAKIHLLIAKVYEKQNNQTLALQHEQKSTALNARMLTSAKDQKLGRLQAQDEAKNLIKEGENKKQQAQMWAISGFVLLLISGVVGAFWFMRIKEKQRILVQKQALTEVQATQTAKALAEATQVVSEQEQALVEAKQVLTEQEQALEVAQQRLDVKDELIQKMELRLAKNTNNAQAMNAQHDDDPKPTASFQGLRLLTTDDWTEFRSVFDQRFPNFIEGVKTQFPNITPAEMRLILLLKTEFEVSEIANILGISTASVYTSRYRLRQKWGMEENADLDAFVKSM